MADHSDSEFSDDEIFDSQDYKDYCAEVKASEGFEVKSYPRVVNALFGTIMPVALVGADGEEVIHYTKKAIEEENKKKDTKLAYERVVRATFRPACPYNYHITFEAKDVDGQIKTYQTKVCVGVKDEDYSIMMFRLKPTTEQGSAPKEEVGHCYKKQRIEDVVDVTEEKGDHCSKKQKIED